MRPAQTDAIDPRVAAMAGEGSILSCDDDAQRPGRGASERITALGELARGIAHDFGNVLAVIECGLRLAEDSLDRPREARAYLAGVHEGVGRGRLLTSRLLGFARPGEIEPEAADANVLIERIAPFLKYAAGPGIRIVLRLADRVPICVLEPSRFSAAMLNLVINARDAMPHGGEIEIRTEARETGTDANRCSCLQVSVADTGLGMSPGTARRIFETGFTTKGEGGNGLGLPQVRQFIRSSGGRVRVSSEPGLGTRFDMLFPAAGSGRKLSADPWRELDRSEPVPMTPAAAARHAVLTDPTSPTVLRSL